MVLHSGRVSGKQLMILQPGRVSGKQLMILQPGRVSGKQLMILQPGRVSGKGRVRRVTGPLLSGLQDQKERVCLCGLLKSVVLQPRVSGKQLRVLQPRRVSGKRLLP
jgi:hypothetical protein